MKRLFEGRSMHSRKVAVYFSLALVLTVTACASQPRPPVASLVQGVESREKRIEILAGECEQEVSYGHIQLCPPHQTCIRDRTHVSATRSVCSTLVQAVMKGEASEALQARKRCLAEADRGKGVGGRETHEARQKELCEAIYRERK